MLIKVPSVVNLGLETIKVDVEVNLANRGLPGFEIAIKAKLVYYSVYVKPVH